MKLLLESGYPHPLPEGFDVDAYDASENQVFIEGVRHFEWRRTLTLEFADWQTCQRAQEASGYWRPYGFGPQLEAVVSDANCYWHPSIVYGDKAYRGFALLDY